MSMIVAGSGREAVSPSLAELRALASAAVEDGPEQERRAVELAGALGRAGAPFWEACRYTPEDIVDSAAAAHSAGAHRRAAEAVRRIVEACEPDRRQDRGYHDLIEAAAWAADLPSPRAVVRAVIEGADGAAADFAAPGETTHQALRRALWLARIEMRGWDWTRPERAVLGQEADRRRAREDAWEAAFSRAEGLSKAGTTDLAQIAGLVALEVGSLDVDGVADAVVTAAHLAGLKPQEGALAFAEHAATAARRAATPASSPRPEEPRQPAASAFDLNTEPGLLGDVARWCSASAFRPVPEFALPATLGFLAALFGRRFATPTGLGLNLYLVGIAQTGGGKDALVSAPKALLSAAGFRHLIGPGDFTSDAAIEMAVRARPVQVMCIDEFGKLAQAMTGRAAPHFAKLAAKALLELYPRSAPLSEWTGKQRVGDGRDSAGEPVYSPTLSLVGVSTPAGFFEGMTEATLDDGMLNRLTLVVGGAPGPRQKDPDRLTVPPALLDAIQAAHEASNAGNLAGARSRDSGAPQTIRCVRWADRAAEAAIEVVEAWEDDARDAGRAGICGRAAEQTQKVATLRALARNPASPAVTEEDVLWGWSFVRASINALEDGARQFMASSAFEELAKGIEREVTKFGWGGIAFSKLLENKVCSKSTPRQVEEALQRLVERGVVIVDTSGGGKGGRPGRRIRLRNREEE